MISGHAPCPPLSFAVAAVPLLQVASTTLIVNLRHVFYALSFPLDRVDGALAKVYSTYALTDEAYAGTSADPGRVSARGWTTLSNSSSLTPLASAACLRVRLWSMA